MEKTDKISVKIRETQRRQQRVSTGVSRLMPMATRCYRFRGYMKIFLT